jgi:hypothetical protein
MWWYIAFGIVFSIYALDLLFLFLASLFAAVVEYFVPPISTAATRRAEQRGRLVAAKQQRAAAAAKGSKRGSAGGDAAATAAAATAPPAGGKPADLAIVVDTRSAAGSEGGKGGGSRPASAAGAAAPAGSIPGTDRFGHLTDLYRGEFPKVMIQLPMYNEDAHCDLIIQRCCKVMWPSHRILIQVRFGPGRTGQLGWALTLAVVVVRCWSRTNPSPADFYYHMLNARGPAPPNQTRPPKQVCDDSTREAVRKKVDAAVIAALEQGHNVQLVRRDNRQGFKAGAMVDGMARVEDQGFEYVAIFDADFEPPEDFFYNTVRRFWGVEAAGGRRACLFGVLQLEF